MYYTNYMSQTPCLGAQWLATTRYSSFSATAAGWGMGPGGRMERVELHCRPILRFDWGREDCGAVGAADPAQAATCPNTGRPSYRDF